MINRNVHSTFSTISLYNGLIGIPSAGKYVHNLGLQASNLISCSNHALNSSLDTVATKMKDEGYATHLIGKKVKSSKNTYLLKLTAVLDSDGTAQSSLFLF